MFAVELLAELIRRGVRDVVVCPGSRSQALALAAAAAEQAGAMRLHVRSDERSAAFFALGVARETGQPAPVIVTSGTAVANLTPAVLEAHEARVPMILLTADRPPELHGIRSNQTTAQAGMFERFARLSLNVPAPEFGDDGDLRRDDDRDPSRLAIAALAAANGFPGEAPAGPVQLNLAFAEPLSGTAGFDEMIAAGFEQAAEDAAYAADAAAQRPRGAVQRSTAEGWEIHLGEWSDSESFVFGAVSGSASSGADPEPTEPPFAVVVAGEGAGPEAETFAHAAGIPLLAEVVSGARFGREAITAYSTLLDDPRLGGLVEQAIVFGHPTLTRQVPALLKRDDVEVIVVDPHTSTDHFNPSRRARIVRSAIVADEHNPRSLHGWLGAWVVADRALQRERSTLHEPDLDAALASGYKERNAYARAEVAVMREGVTRELLVESVWRATWPHDRLMLAASRLVRVLDGLAPARRLEVCSNRGLAGIDGTVATALGVATASQAAQDPAQSVGTTRVLLGDLALLHDAGSLALAAGEDRPRIQLFVGNDGGGTIFDGLEVAGSASRSAFDRVLYTPQKVSLSALAEAYGWEYRLVSTRGELEQLLTVPVTGPMLVEVPLGR
ncbi:2-succinyl-5-enolpyruvyl-6-hydroxy-3-cyclohexene-1-carboxylic-acid synthase [Leucobacter viscericola]|uniref:2-succinyl-5-enolpyruvyl-6-hydroxy-3-cyclohexene-1-carboxylate synthase n=1 Tax=Leucobacter viscericola TaxID=2714935 RepID=A0A6G7XJQ7_9MICO|nr:2-succinyl-5-enolpyruvyl-6-hydroxy-3-cyclohexene-1-carboxylic-acid synthase [Leucobacter viscericola]QIK64830.1 2-succinyl-5-enolpyruvyl-6-hydroxy-3-cyclohexene-1-carboxylic-acid synthase [Leucobacter viscericola]